MVETERRNEIVCLLTHRNDHLPLPVSRSVSSSGFVGGADAKGRPLRSLSCPDCLANGRVMFGCETCGGSGEIPDDGKDPMDDPLKNPPPHPLRKTHWDVDRAAETASRDRVLAILENQLAPPKSEATLLAEANRRGEAWEEERRAMYRRFDFARLDFALDELRSKDADAAHALNAVYVDGWMAEVGIITPLAEQLCERAIVFLSARLPEQLRTGLAPAHPAESRQSRRRAA
jgi:hypothetical protein